MSLITRCPSCQTSFRVVPDQLRISEGWVRCGQCSEIFDASAALVKEDAILGAEPVLKPPGVAIIDSMSSDHIAIPLEPLTAGLQEVPAQSFEFGALDAGADAESSALFVSGDGAQPSPAVLPSALPAIEEDTAVQEPAPGLVADATADWSIPPSFLRAMPKRSVWHRGWVRAALALTALVLLSVLAAQVVIQERDRIAAMFPPLRPAVVWVCNQAGCGVGPLRRIEAVVIEGSSFNKTRSDSYRLSLVVRNTSALDIALPALELTLTDSLDQAVMRRIFTPSDLGAANMLIKAGGEWSGNISLAVRPASGLERFSGYKVLAFYP